MAPPPVGQRAVQAEGAQAKGDGQDGAQQLGGEDAGVARQQGDALQRRQLGQLRLRGGGGGGSGR